MREGPQDLQTLINSGGPARIGTWDQWMMTQVGTIHQPRPFAFSPSVLV
jgi:hypothetical protein